MEEDYTSVYLKGVYDERDKWKSKVKEKIEEIKSNPQYNWVGTEWQECEVVGLLEELLEE